MGLVRFETRKIRFENEKPERREFVNFQTAAGVNKQMAVKVDGEKREGKFKLAQIVVHMGAFEFRQTLRGKKFGNWNVKRLDGKKTRSLRKSISERDVISDVAKRYGDEVSIDVYEEILTIRDEVLG